MTSIASVSYGSPSPLVDIIAVVWKLKIRQSCNFKVVVTFGVVDQVLLV